MYYTKDECKAICDSLKNEWSLKRLNLADSDKMYLSEVCETDIDNLHNCLNVWCSLFADLTGYDPSILKGYIRQRSVVAVILEAKRLRVDFIRTHFNYSIFKIGTPWYMFTRKITGYVPEQAVLMILGFPKRLHFTKANLGEIAIGNLLEVNRNFSNYSIPRGSDGKKDGWEYNDYHFHPCSLKYTSGKWTPYVSGISFADHAKQRAIIYIRRHIKELLPKDFSLDSFILPPRSTYELHRENATYINKYYILSMQKKFVSRFMELPDHYYIPFKVAEQVTYRGRLVSVPKDVGAYRTVMPEEVARQFVGYAYTDQLEQSFKENCPYLTDMSRTMEKNGISVSKELATFGALDLHCQERNQVAARYGSVTNLLATIDYSQASDTNSVELSRLLFPKAHFDFLNSIRAKQIVLPDGKVVNSNIMFTMGFSTTFPCESIIFTAFGRAAVDLSWGFISSTERKAFGRVERALACVFSYGDDLIIPSFAVDALRMLSEMFGLKINMDKSYWDSPYRESCGKEYYNGIDITTEYFPRGTSSTRLAELIGLQHKLFVYPTVNAFIIEKCAEYRTKLTSNRIGSPYMDIWGYESPDVSYRSPYSSDRGVLIFGNTSIPIRRVEGESGCWTLESGDKIRIRTESYIPKTTSRWIPLKEYIFYYTEVIPKYAQGVQLGKLPYDGLRTLKKPRVVYPTQREKDQEPYCEVTVPKVSFSGQVSHQAWEDADRLGYVFKLYDMYKRSPMTDEEYLKFMLERDRECSVPEYGSDFGIIDHSQLKNSLTKRSSFKLVRKLVHDDMAE